MAATAWEKAAAAEGVSVVVVQPEDEGVEGGLRLPGAATEMEFGAGPAAEAPATPLAEAAAAAATAANGEECLYCSTRLGAGLSGL